MRGIGIQISKLEKVKKTPGNLSKLFSNMSNITKQKQNQNNETVISESTSPQKINSTKIELNGVETLNAKRGKGRPRGRGGKTIERKSSNNGNLNKFLTLDNSASTSTMSTSTLPQVILKHLSLTLIWIL